MGTGGLFLRKLRAKVSERPTGFAWIESGRLACSGFPASRSQLRWLHDQGIMTILTLTEDQIPARWLEGLDFEVRHVPMEDHQPPDGVSLDNAATIVMESVEEKKTTLVHCLAGKGRTGCVLAAYLIKSRKTTGEEAVTILRQINPSFIERGQEQTIFEYGRTEGSSSNVQASTS